MAEAQILGCGVEELPEGSLVIQMTATRFMQLLEAVPTRQQIEAFMQELQSTEKYDEGVGVSYWGDDPEAQHCTVCTSGARLIARKFGGVVRGYAEGGNPTARAGKPGGTWDAGDTTNQGHDFAIVGPFIVDYWLHHVTDDYHKALFDVRIPAEAEEVRILYGDPSRWVRVSNNNAELRRDA